MSASRRLTSKFLGAAPWMLAEGFFNAVYGVGFVLLLGWFVPPAEFGRASLAVTIVQLVEIISKAGLQDALIRARSGHCQVSDTAHTMSVLLSAAGAAACVLLAYPAAHFYGEPKLATLTVAASLTLPLNALCVAPIALLTRKMRASRLTLRLIFGKIVSLAALVALGLVHAGEWAFVGAVIAMSLGSVAVLLATPQRWPRFRFDRREARSLLSFGVWSSIDALIWGLTVRLFALLVGYVHGAAAFGGFQFALRIVDEVANLIQGIVVRFGLSYFAALERAEIAPQAAFLKGTTLLTLLGAPTFLGLAAVAPEATPLLFGARWTQSIVPLQILAASWAIAFPRVLVPTTLRARGYQREIVQYAAISSTIALICGVLAAPFSISFAALAWTSRHLYGIPWAFTSVRDRLRIPVRAQVACVWRPMAAALLMTGAIGVIQRLASDQLPIVALLMEIGGGIIIYVGAIAVIDRESVRLVGGLIERFTRRR